MDDESGPRLLVFGPLLEGLVVVSLLLALAAAGTAALVRPDQAVTGLDVVLAVAAVQALLLRPAACAALTATSVASVAMPPVLRTLWQGTGLPTVIDDLLAALRLEPVHRGGFDTPLLSPVPGVPGVTGLLAAVAGVLAVTAAARAFRTAVHTRRPVARDEQDEPEPQALDTTPPEPGEPVLLPVVANVEPPGRACLLDAAREALARSDRRGGDVVILVAEAHRLEELGQALGRTAAQDVVRQVVRRLRAFHGGRSFAAQLDPGQVALLVEGTEQDSCDLLAARVAALLDEPMTVAGQAVGVRFSIGVSATAGDSDAVQLLVAAEQAVAEASRGRARWIRHDRVQQSRQLADGLLELELRNALRHRQIRVVFQPIVRLGSDGGGDRGIAVEALARWTTASGVAVEPLRFVPLAEQAGLGPELGRQVLECGLDAVAGWYAAGYPVGRLSVNLAQSQLESAGFVETLVAQLGRRELPGSCLMVELAAGSIAATPRAGQALDRLTALGVQVLVDDFGVPGLSVAGLAGLPLSAVKLDRSLATDLSPTGPAAATVALCRSLGVRSIAEGVESADQLQAARRLGVDAVQGRLVGPPVRARDLSAMLASSHRTRVVRTTAAAVPGPGRPRPEELRVTV